jgi:hypothetical protein
VVVKYKKLRYEKLKYNGVLRKMMKEIRILHIHPQRAGLGESR